MEVNKKEQVTNTHLLDKSSIGEIFSEHVKAKMANEWRNRRSIGNEEQDSDCYFDYLTGIEDAVKLILKSIK